MKPPSKPDPTESEAGFVGRPSLFVHFLLGEQEKMDR